MSAANIQFEKNEKPVLWEPAKALTFFELANRIDVYLRAGMPVTRETMLVICFHETAFSNIKQGRGSGPAIGFGQMEIFNYDKIPFWATLGYDSRNGRRVDIETRGTGLACAPQKVLMPLNADSLLANDDLAIKAHCKYFEWLYDCNNKRSLRGMLEAQTGSTPPNNKFVDIFAKAADNLRAVIYSGDRAKVIEALNSVRSYWDFKQNKMVRQALAPGKPFDKYWDYTLPASQMAFGLRV
jgi:hypothetical protein